MIRLKMVLSASLMMSLLIFSGKTWGQNNPYPKKIVYKGDTLVLVTMDQVDSLNIAYVEKDQYKELSDSLNSSIKGYEVVILKCEEVAKELEEKIGLVEQIIEQKDIIIEEERDEKKKLKRKIKRLKFFNGVLVVISVVLGTIIIVSTL